ncbi:FtsX-like permease family protein [Agreia sp. Leaf283]|uniref:FtsX-like permease family protein n=1 Tax=Agreia sp. Leaf283 TaxID=1736321 RepID=UPI0006FC2790|nr:FtsX-like permease family protein [Agreia sp. Leaf283]KQP56118.1 hypothetical protein ASF51_13430 [Agreia sp. Leaf283]
MTRLRESAPILGAILVVVALVCAFSVATSAYLDRQATTGLRAELSAQTGEDLALRASLDIADDADQQDAEVRRAIAKTFDRVEVEFETTRTLEAGAIYSTSDRSGPAEALTVPDLASRAAFDTGAAPVGVDEVAVQADAAAALGLHLGDEVILNRAPFTVSGTWRALDALDPRWYGDESVETGGSSDRLGPFVITEDAWTRFDLPPKAVWTVVPASIDDFTSINGSSVSAAWDTVERAWRGEVSGFDSLQVQRQLARTLDDFDDRVEGLKAIEPAAAVLVAGSALVALWQLVQLLVAARERETLLFWARGRSTTAIASRVTGEVAVTALLGAVVGVSAVALGLFAVSEAGQGTLVRPSAFAVPAVVLIGAIVIAAVSSYRSATSVTQSTQGGRGGTRARRAALPGAVLLVAIAAALSVWQLRRYGSPLTPDAEGTSSIDPIVVIAPAVALIAVVLIALAAFPAVVGLYARRTRNSGVGTHLAARTLARQTTRIAAPLVIVALAVGAATVAATFSATWAHLYAQNAALHSGADVRISSPLAPLSAEQRDTVAGTKNITDVVPVDVQTLSVGTVTGSVVAATPDALRQGADDAGGIFSPDDAADAIHVDDPGPIIPVGATSLTLRVEARHFDESPAVSAWIADSLGSLRRVVFESPTIDADGVLAYTVVLIDGADTAPGSLVSLDISFANQSFDAVRPSFRVKSLDAQVDGAAEAVELGQFWLIDTLSEFSIPPESTTTGDGFVLDSPLPSLRMTVSSDGTASDYLRPPIVVSEPLARSLDLQIGDTIALSLRDAVGDANAVVTAIVPAIPAADSDNAALIDLSVINHLHQRVSSAPAESTDLWVTTARQQQVRDSVRGVVPANAHIGLRDDPEARQVLGAAAIAFWAAASACLLFAFIAVGSASSSRLRWGRADIAALRALGMRAGEQSAVLVRELVLVLVVAVLAGVAAGALVSVLTVPQLARAAVDRGYLSSTATLAVDWPGLLLLLGALVVGVAVVLIDLSRRVRYLASRLLPSEGHE